jgi:hypothetical protein
MKKDIFVFIALSMVISTLFSKENLNLLIHDRDHIDETEISSVVTPIVYPGQNARTGILLTGGRIRQRRRAIVWIDGSIEIQLNNLQKKENTDECHSCIDTEVGR